jgi:predicted nucleotidyltransferase
MGGEWRGGRAGSNYQRHLACLPKPYVDFAPRKIYYFIAMQGLPRQATEVEIETRRRRAIEGARAASDILASKGIKSMIFGSLAKAGTFGIESDVDILLIDCPRRYKYAVESDIERALGDLPFHAVYLEEVLPDRAARLTAEAVDAAELV